MLSEKALEIGHWSNLSFLAQRRISAAWRYAGQPKGWHVPEHGCEGRGVATCIHALSMPCPHNTSLDATLCHLDRQAIPKETPRQTRATLGCVTSTSLRPPTQALA